MRLQNRERDWGRLALDLVREELGNSSTSRERNLEKEGQRKKKKKRENLRDSTPYPRATAQPSLSRTSAFWVLAA